jgi:hypothetical protein
MRRGCWRLALFLLLQVLWPQQPCGLGEERPLQCDFSLCKPKAAAKLNLVVPAELWTPEHMVDKSKALQGHRTPTICCEWALTT